MLRFGVFALFVVACSAKRDERIAPHAGMDRAATTSTDPAGHRTPRRTAATDSSIAAADYIGPDGCGECHPDQLAMWKTSLHRVMNQRVEPPPIEPRASGSRAGDARDVARAGDARDVSRADVARVVIADPRSTLHYRGGDVRIERDATGGYAMVLARGAQAVRYRITRTIGRRALQEYVGVREGDPSGEEVRLPVGWWPRRGGLYPQPYFDPWLGEDDIDIYAPVREPWAERCPWCHSTYPFAQRIARASGPKALGHGLEQYFAGAPGGIRLDVAQQITTGISCESCHLGGRAHADGAAIHFVPLGAQARARAPVPTTFAAERQDASIVNHVCAQCHSGPSPRLPDGTATRNSSEALDLAASPCTTARCTQCHDPHLGGASEARAVEACVGCHRAFRDPETARAHAGSGHVGVSCLDCHMPRVTMGVDRFVRSHRISSPTDRVMLAAAAPNACNLCHLDRSIRWTLDELRARYDVRVDPGNLDAYGDPDAGVGGVWLASAEPDIRITAAMAYARGPLRTYALRDVVPLLDDPRPYVRAWSVFAVEDILGRKLRDDEYDPRAPSPVRRAAIEKLQR